MPPEPIPNAYRNATPYLIVNDATKAIEFYRSAFGATELVRLADAAGKVMHAECASTTRRSCLRMSSRTWGIAVRDRSGDLRCPYCFTSQTLTRNLLVSLLLGQQKQCRSQTGSMAIRRGTLTDPFGHVWLLATRKENISLEEMRQRFETMMKQGEWH